MDRAAFRVIGGSLQDDDAFAVGRDIVMRQGPVRIDWSFGKQALHLSAIFRSKTTDTPSYRLRLSGRPDYLIERTEGLVPVELKSGACPRSGPHAAHVAQLMTYCVLVEDTLARPVPYGFLQYSHARRQIPFTADRKREVLQFTDEIRRKRGSANVHRATPTQWSLSEVRHRSACEEDLS